MKAVLTELRNSIFVVFDAFQRHVKRTSLQADFTISSIVDRVSDAIRDLALYAVGSVFTIAGVAIDAVFASTRVALGGLIGFPPVDTFEEVFTEVEPEGGNTAPEEDK